MNTSALSARERGIKAARNLRFGSCRCMMQQLRVLRIRSSVATLLHSRPRKFSLIIHNTGKSKSPGISHDQAEGRHILSPSHSGKWIPLPRVISVSYNKELIHNVTHSEMQNYSQGSLQGCAGAIRILPLGPWWVPLSGKYPGSTVINLSVNMHDLGLCLSIMLNRV